MKTSIEESDDYIILLSWIGLPTFQKRIYGHGSKKINKARNDRCAITF